MKVDRGVRVQGTFFQLSLNWCGLNFGLATLDYFMLCYLMLSATEAVEGTVHYFYVQSLILLSGYFTFSCCKHICLATSSYSITLVQ